MNDPVSRHPGAETMAAFLEGKLAPGAVAEVAAHLRDCADCRTVTGEAARFEQEEERLRQRKRRVFSGWRGWTAAAAAAAAAVAATIPLLRPSPLMTLIDASPREYRRVAGRLSGFPYAPLHGHSRGFSTTPAEYEQTSAANEVLARTTNDDAVDARHAAGVAHLLIDQTAAGRDALASAAGDSKDAHVWNDLAVARFAVAVGGDEPAQLPLALAAVDRAIRLDPKLAEAYFNRALILERMKLPDAARKAWKRYLEVDPSSAWSNEARSHLSALGNTSADLDFTKELARAAGNRDAIVALVRRVPQEARLKGEGRLLGEWADTIAANDAPRAEEKLTVIRTIAEELAASKGERLLLGVVQAIDAVRDRRAFAAAYEIYKDARVAYSPKQRDLPAAENGFRRAAAAFRAVRSPLADVAEYYTAQCAFDLNRPAESTEALRALRKRIDPSDRALSAEIEWTLTRNANARADWGNAAEDAQRASATFRALGEKGNAATMSAMGAIALERTGALDLAWQRRIDALADVAGDPQRVASILHSGAVALAAADQVDAAAALLDVAIETECNSELRAVVLTERARLAERAGDLVAARRWLGEARTETASLKDAALNEARTAQLDLTDAVLRRASDPNGAIAALDESIAFFERQGSDIFLPEAYLQRARTYRALQQSDSALEDYNAALRKIAGQQEKVGPDALSVEFLDVAAQAIDETVELHLERREVAEAFAVADRAHAMASAGYRTAPVPEGTAVIEYMVLPHAVAIFCMTRDGIAAKRVPIERAALAARVTSFARQLWSGQDVLAGARSLHALLIAPIAAKLAGARELVIVPDRQLNVLPFTALHDGKRYLIETAAVRVAPSAAATPEGRAEASPVSSAVVIADPASDRAVPLQWSRDEAAKIAGIYGATAIYGAGATRERVSAAMASSAIVHYAGHAENSALLLASSAGDSGLLTAGDIARLDLRARPLVVLAACRTLRGDTTHVAGMPSLARAFLGAGAHAVVGTLWEIDDDVAAPLFLEFHKRLRAGEVPAGALRAAQLAMLQSSEPRLRHPAAWSAVEVLSNL
jgi:CHAT domain-containing protein